MIAQMPPVLKYPGAKWRIADWIMDHMPSHESYVEPFFGSGAILFRKAPSRIETVNDLDGSVVHFFKVCREQPEALARAVYLTPWAREEYNLSEFHADGELPDDVERARQFAVRSWMAMGSCMSRKTGWRHTTGKKTDGGPDNPKLWGRMPEQIVQIGTRLLAVQIENRPALNIIQRFDGPHALLYVDPPYLPETRTAHRDQYRFEMTVEDHRDLLEALTRHRGMILLSGYDSGLYQSTLADWHLFQRAAVAERGAKRTECLWLNPLAMERLCQQQTVRNQLSVFEEQEATP